MKLVYTVDPNHTTVGFKTKHLMVTTVHGKFKEWTGQVEGEEGKPETAVVTGTIKAASIDTGNAQRDKDVLEKVLDAEHYPEITYGSTEIEPLGDHRFRVTGDLTIAGKTRPVVLDVVTEEEFTDGFGFKRVGFSATGRLRRKDWDLTWNVVFEAGRMLLSEEVQIEIDGALVRKAEKPAEAAVRT